MGGEPRFGLALEWRLWRGLRSFPRRPCRRTIRPLRHSARAPQLTRALAQIEALPTTPALRREQIELQVAFANALIHTRGYGASETKMAFDQARALIERAEALGEPPEDPLIIFSSGLLGDLLA